MVSSLSSYTPAPEVKLAGAVPDGFPDLLVAMTVEESVAGLARCELRLDNWGIAAGGPGYVFADRSTIDFGKTVEVAAGPPDERSTIFSGRITGIEAEYAAHAGPTVVVLAEDPLQELRMTRRTRTFEDLSDADVVEQIASDHGLTADADLDGPTHAALCQLNKSDLAFLRDRALPLAADVWLDGTTLHIGKRADDPIVLRLGRELLAFRVLADLALQATEQRVAGWNPSTKEEVLETADQSSLGSDLGSDLGGGGLLSDSFGSRPATTTLAGAVTAAEATALARGLYWERARRFVTGSGLADGLAGLRAGRSVSLEGLGAMFDGTYRLSRVAHRYDQVEGYRTAIEVERAGVGA
jgi:phage protein D